MATGSNSAVIARVAAALYDVQLGNASMSWALDQVDRVHAGNVGALVQGVINNDAALKALTPAQMAAVIVKNVGVTTGVADAEAYVAAQLTAAGAANYGTALVSLLNAYTALPASNPYGAAAASFKTQITAADAYAQTIGTVDRVVHPPLTAAQIFNLAGSTALGVDVMRLTGGMDVRIDFTNPANQIRGLDLDGDGLIETNGIENVSSNFPAEDRGANFEIVDAYARNPLNHTDSVNNFLGDIAFDGTGFKGDGVATNGNVFLGGLGVDVAFGGDGNDFLAAGGIAQGRTGMETLRGGRNADFFFAEFSGIDATDGGGANGTNTLFIDGGDSSDSTSGGVHGSQDSDWLLFEGSDDDEVIFVTLDEVASPATSGLADGGRVISRSGETMDIDDIENFDASGNLYGMLDGLNVEIGGRATDDRDATAATVGYNYSIGSSAQMNITGSGVANIIIAGYDNDVISGGAGNDILFGGNLKFLNNPNLVGIVNDGRDVIDGGANNDSIVFDADGGSINGDTGTDTLFLTNYALGTRTAADMTSDGFLRFDLETQTNLSQSAGYGGANVSGTADQTNYKSGVVGGRNTVTGMESVIATGMGAIDYKAAGANTPELTFTNQQNQMGYQGNLDLRGSGYTGGLGETVDNVLYANSGTDVLEGRHGRDLLSGGDGNDDFYFFLQDNAGDGLDTVHRQSETAAGSNLHNGLFERDFNIGGATTVGASSLTVDLGTTNLASADVAMTSFTIKIGGATFAVTDTAALAAANSAAEVAALVNAAYKAIDAKVSAVAVGNTIVVTDTGGRDISDTVAEGYFVGGVVSNGAFSALATFAPAGSSTTADRLIYKSYEDRLDNEGVDDDSFLGSTISLGSDAYAEDLVIWFGDEDGDGLATTRIAEDQAYNLDFTNLTTQDKVTVSVNGVNYTLQVGVDLDGNTIAAEDGVGAETQAEIQHAFLNRLNNFINSFMDDDTVAGKVASTVRTTGVTVNAVDLNNDGDTLDAGEAAGSALATGLQISQAAYNGEETVFMVRPVVTMQNLSGGEAASVAIENQSEHELELLDFDGRNGELHEMNVLFVGQEFVNRAELSTGKNAGGTQTGTEATVIDVGANNLQDVVFGTTTAIPNNTATNAPLSVIANGWSVHGDDFLLGGNGVDTINGGTGDDRVEGSTGNDIVDGGKNFYAIQVLGEPQARVYILNKWEAANPTKVTALQGLTISSITLINQNESGTGVISGEFDDTLQFSQNNFGSNARFTVTLNDFVVTGGVVELRNDGAGTVGVDANGDGVIETTTKFTNFENIRTVSGRGNAVANDGQGNDTLDVTALSTTTTGAGGIHYNLTNDNVVDGITSTPGQVRYSSNTIIAAAPDAQFPQTNDYETAVIKVDGVENVIASNGADMVVIDETEAAKNNTFTAGLGIDRIQYLNDFDGAPTTGVAEPTVTIKVDNVAASLGGTDTVTMTGGRVGSTVAVDTLGGVEFITLSNETAQGTREDDVLDVTAMTAGAVVSYVDGTVKDLGGVTHLTVQGIDEIENIWADGNDTVLVADVDAMSAINGRSDAGTLAGNNDADITFVTFADFDTISGTNARVPFVQQTTAQIEDVINQFQYKFNLSKTGTGADSDTVDYSNAVDNISVVVELDVTKPNQYVLVDGDGGTFYDAVGDLEEAGDRVDQLTSVERIVAAQGESVLDLSGSTKGLEIKYSAFDVANQVASLDRDVYSVRISDLSTASPLQRTFVEYRDAGTSGTVTQPKAVWSRIEGSDNAEVVILNSAHSADTNTFNLRGGANQVKYNELTKSIQLTLSVSDFVSTDADGVDNIFGNADDTGLIKGEVKFFDGNGNAAGNLTAGPGGTHNISSYTANNGVATGSLRVAASQDAEDTLAFQGLSDKLFLLAEAGTVDNQITVKLGSGTAQNSVVLTGFEFVQDSQSNDIYDFGSIVNASIGLDFVDNAVADHDTVKVDNGAKAFNGAGATEISLATINTSTALAAAGFDFDVLDVTKVTDTAVTTLTGVAAGEGTDEVVIGKINGVTNVNNFEATVLTQATVAEVGTTFVINTTANTIVAGAKTLTFNNNGNNVLSFGGTVLEQAAAPSHLRVATDLNATSAVTVTVSGTEAVNITGGNGNDSLTGGSAGDTLRGGSGADTLNGNFVPEALEVHTYVISNPAGGAGETVIIDGFTVTEGATIQGVAVANNDADAIGAAFVRQWNASPASFTNNASIQSLTYDALTNALTFTFKSSAGNVSDTLIGAAAGTAAASVGAETVTTAYAAQTESADTYVFESTAALNGDDVINNFNANGVATDDVLDFRAFLGTAGLNTGVVTTPANFATGLSLWDAVAANQIAVVYNKGTLAASDITVATNATVTASKISMEAGSKAVIVTTADADGVADATNNAYNVYFVSVSAGGAVTVDKVGTLNSSSELSAMSFQGMSATVTGTAGNDTLTGNGAANTISGLAGNDTLNGLAGADTLNGDAGDDTLNGGDDGDTLNGGADNDTLNGDAGNDTLNGDAGNDTLTGGAGNDTIVGGAGTDTVRFNLLTGEGTDSITGYVVADDAIQAGGALKTALDDDSDGALEYVAADGADAGNQAIVGGANQEATVLVDAEVEITAADLTQVGLANLLAELGEEIDFTAIATGQEHMFLVQVSATETGLVLYTAAAGGDDVITAAELQVIGIVTGDAALGGGEFVLQP